MSVKTGVESWFNASHRKHATGVVHGHTWRVRAWWPAGNDAEEYLRMLDWACIRFRDTTLPPALFSAEAIAEHFGRNLGGCVQVDVWRDAERMVASWTP